MNKVKDEFIINLQGKSFVTYEGLLDYAHSNGLESIEVEIIQFPNNQNNMTAICKATAKTKDKSFTDIGDASPKSVNNIIVPHLIRMASTRAKARALRDMTNIGMTAYEELTSNDSGPISNSEKPTNRQVDTLKQLSQQLNYKVDYENLNKDSAGLLISELLSRINKNPHRP